jgi:tetratricopeptide (TPR) repeat protein
MRAGRSSRVTLALVLSLTVALIGACTAKPRERGTVDQPARPDQLGAVAFPTTCSPPAHSRFLRGVAALHSFWYPVALDEFRAATQLDPGCIMGYWGEAMAHNHPLWGDPQETEAARRVLERIGIPSGLPARERAWLDAVRALYGEGDKATRDRRHAAAMEKIHREYPDDAEAALFHALALLATVRTQDAAGEATRLRAGELAWAVYRKHPDHPGAAHYVIHAYDDPEHAHLALDAARRYAEIAPDAPHALHMPSHIFVQLGMWPEAAASNEAAWAASDRWVKRKSLPISQRDHHSLHWLMYAYAQQGHYDRAQEQLRLMRQSLVGFPADDPRGLAFGTFTYAVMAATLLIETERWEAAGQWLPPLGLPPPGPAAGARAPAGGAADPYRAYAVVAQIPAVFARGLAAAATGAPAARESRAVLREIREKASGASEPLVAELVRLTEVQELEIAAMAAAARKDFDQAIALMRKATALEDATPPPPGPPAVIKPAHELLGGILLRAGRPEEAAKAFAASLRRHPNRARSLLGAARAAVRGGQASGAVTLGGSDPLARGLRAPSS